MIKISDQKALEILAKYDYDIQQAVDMLLENYS